MVLHTISKSIFFRREGFFEGLSSKQLCIVFLCPYQGCKNRKGWHLLAEPNPWDWFALPQMIYSLGPVHLGAGGKRNNSFDEKTNSLSQFLDVCAYASCWTLVSEGIAELILVSALAVEGKQQVGGGWSHYPKYWEIYTETRGPDVYIFLSLYGSWSWHARCPCGIYRTAS